MLYIGQIFNLTFIIILPHYLTFPITWSPLGPD